MWTVYLLRDPIAPNVCYVGMTGCTMARRLRNHRTAARSERSPRAQWLNALFTLGLAPRVEVLGTFAAQRAACDEERRLIAELGHEPGVELMNRAPGGYHIYDHAFRVAQLKAAFAQPAEKARKSRASRKSAREGWKDAVVRDRRTTGMKRSWTEERKAKMRALWADPAHRAARLAAQKAAFAKPEEKARKSAVMRARYESPEQRAKTGASTSATWNDPDVRQRRSIGISRALLGRAQRRDA